MLFLNSMKLIVTSLAGTIGISSLELEWEACLHFLLLGALFQWICVLYVCRDPSEVEVQLQEKKEKKDHEQGGKKFSPSIYIYQYCKHSHANSILRPIASAQLHKLSTFSYWQIFLFFHDYRNQSIHFAVVIFFWPGNFIPL